MFTTDRLAVLSRLRRPSISPTIALALICIATLLTPTTAHAQAIGGDARSETGRRIEELEREVEVLKQQIKLLSKTIGELRTRMGMSNPQPDLTFPGRSPRPVVTDDRGNPLLPMPRDPKDANAAGSSLDRNAGDREGDAIGRLPRSIIPPDEASAAPPGEAGPLSDDEVFQRLLAASRRGERVDLSDDALAGEAVQPAPKPKPKTYRSVSELIDAMPPEAQPDRLTGWDEASAMEAERWLLKHAPGAILETTANVLGRTARRVARRDEEGRLQVTFEVGLTVSPQRFNHRNIVMDAVFTDPGGLNLPIEVDAALINTANVVLASGRQVRIRGRIESIAPPRIRSDSVRVSLGLRLTDYTVLGFRQARQASPAATER